MSTSNTESPQRPDVEKALSPLKDFQRRTVETVFRRLYTDQDCTHRFLIADEVGLGKTMVARGVIARAIDRLWDTPRRIDIVYICSNTEIARQNLNRLNPTQQKEFNLASRITLLPTEVHDLKNKKLNFVSFTPGTSFDLRSRLGTAKERALLFWLLKDAWRLQEAGARHVLRGRVRKGTFRGRVKDFNEEHSIDEELKKSFLVRVDRQAQLKEEFVELCRSFESARGADVKRVHLKRIQLIGELRAFLAATCIQALEPDLIILDEFQRFSELLHGDSPASELANPLFDYEHETEKARVLLLSATPYKMFTLADEAATDDHYVDFLRTLRFLQDDPAQSSEAERLLKEYRLALFRLGDGAMDRLRELKAQIEAMLRRVMVRTERLASSEHRSGMLQEVTVGGLALDTGDLGAYVGVQRIADHLDRGNVLEYWKSAPYLLSFMEGYKLRTDMDEGLDDRQGRAALEPLLSASEGGIALPWNRLEAYEPIDPGNARLRWLAAETVAKGAWRLLWIPPSLPDYPLGGAYADPALAGFTKKLVFSAWNVAPRAIATLLSYEAERQMMRSLDPRSTPEVRDRKRPLLRFAKEAEGRLTGMPVLALLYPSFALGRLGDPRRYRELGLSDNRDVLVEAVTARIRAALGPILSSAAVGSSSDSDAWYWAAPVLLDLHEDSRSAREWLGQRNLDRLIRGDEEDDVDSAFAEHVARLHEVACGSGLLGRPPADLANVLAEMALGAPGVVALRALSSVAGGEAALTDTGARTQASRVAWGFRTLFNLPEVMALLRVADDEKAYWQRVIQYGVEGGLGAVLAEYAHVLRESLGLITKPHLEVAEGVAAEIAKALRLRTTSLGADRVHTNRDGGGPAWIEHRRLRARFAMRFGEEKADDRDERTRGDQVRGAFNSPFWPFVLATTSVGQEGLDFHQYCHAVVHWNLPTNPVDLEQREGRVHRYKGHAVRKNVARRFGSTAARAEIGMGDEWEAMFRTAVAKRSAGESDLTPFWVYATEGGAKIERHVPAFPLSRDLERYDALKRALTIYRLVFGQPRQEDLLAYLLTRAPKGTVEAYLDELRIDLSPDSVR